jgi:hypothetical protein
MIIRERQAEDFVAVRALLETGGLPSNGLECTRFQGVVIRSPAPNRFLRVFALLRNSRGLSALVFRFT